MDKAPENLRKPPAYLEYAADILSNLQWRMMSFSERGLWDTLRKECWVNGRVPSDPRELSLLLNKSVEEVSKTLTPRVLAEFEAADGSLTCPELDAYRREQMLRRERMSSGGRTGGKATQRNARLARSYPEVPPEATLKPLRRNELNRNEMSQEEQSPGGDFSEEHQQWVDEYNDGFSEPRHQG
jgi:hypothetical protein